MWMTGPVKSISTALLLACGVAMTAYGSTPTASDIVLSDYVKAKPPQMAPLSVVNLGFEAGSRGWQLPEGFSIEDKAGRNGTAALVYRRTDPGNYKIANQRVELKPGSYYRFGCWMKAERIEGHDEGDTGEGLKIAVQFYSPQDNRYLGGDFLWEPERTDKMITGTTDWKQIEGEFISPAKPVTAMISLYVKKGLTGTAYFDDVYIEELPPKWMTYLIQPKCDTFKSTDARAILGFESGPRDGDTGLYCLATIKDAAGHEARDLKAIESKRCELSFGRLTPGAAAMSVAILNVPRKEIIKEYTYAVRVDDGGSAPANACFIDSHGRAVMNGKLFMPLGLYIANVEKSQADKLASSPFNCVMPYCSLTLNLTGSKKRGIAAIHESLDVLNAHGIKCIFSLKDVWSGHFLGYPLTNWMGARDEFESVTNAVNQFKDHPAIMAWYLADELPWDWSPRITERRHLVNRLDPNHPTWAVYNNSIRLADYASTCDVLGVDPYAINVGTKDIHMVKQWMQSMLDAAETPAGTAAWVVPQATGPQRFPTSTELRAITLLEASMGARGFIFYSMSDLYKDVDEATGERRWREVCQVAATLKELEPFILSAEKPTNLACAVQTGDVMARSLKSEDGRTIAIMTNIGPGAGKATVKVGIDGMKSRFGHCKPLGGGKYAFEASDVSADILEMP